MRSLFPLILLLPVALIVSQAADDSSPREILGHATIHGAKKSSTPNPIQLRAPWGKGRDWNAKPLKFAVVLIEFSDVKHKNTHDVKFYETMLFSRGEYKKTPSGQPVYGSVNDWYHDQSLGRFGITGKVFDWVAVEDAFETVRNLKGKEARERCTIRAMEELKAREGLKTLDDFDSWLFIHAGPIVGPPGNILWSHRSTLLGKSYVITGEIERNGVLCHEFGHTLGLPDLYGKKDVRESIGPWCSMSSGYRGSSPRSFCVWSKTRIGWCEPTVIDAATPQRLALRPIQRNPNDAFVIPLTKDASEYLLLENRDTKGCDAESQAGLFIWRITRTLDGDGKDRHKLKLASPADSGGKSLASRTVTWPAKNATEFVVKPDDGKQFSAAIRNIRREGDLVLFEIGTTLK